MFNPIQHRVRHGQANTGVAVLPALSAGEI